MLTIRYYQGKNNTRIKSDICFAVTQTCYYNALLYPR